MKTPMLISALFLLAAFSLTAGRATAQSCMQPQYSTYDNFTTTGVNQDGTVTLSDSVTIDGGGANGYSCNIPLPGVAHTPTIYINIRGSATQQQGQGVPPQYVIDYTVTHSAEVPVGSSFEVDEEEWVDCNYAGQLFESFLSFVPIVEQSNYKLVGQESETIGGVPMNQCTYQYSCPAGTSQICELNNQTDKPLPQLPCSAAITQQDTLSISPR